MVNKIDKTTFYIHACICVYVCVLEKEKQYIKYPNKYYLI
jgi:hypothetical protein